MGRRKKRRSSVQKGADGATTIELPSLFSPFRHPPKRPKRGRTLTPKERRLQRDTAHRITTLLLWAVTILLSAGAACWCYERSKYWQILLIALASTLGWLGIFASDLEPRKMRRRTRFLDQLSVMPALWGVAGLCVYLVIRTFYDSIGFMAVLIALVLPAPMWYFFVEHLRLIRDHFVTASAKTDMDRLIQTALQTMDSTGSTYESEDSANKELATTLKAMNSQLVVEYQPKVGHGTTADIRIGGVLVEGKLNLIHIDTADGLIGQISRYCRDTNYHITVVVYGKVNHHVWEHVDRDIRDHYEPGRVTLISLPNPHRTARELPGSDTSSK